LQITLAKFEYFRHYRSSTLWLNPQTQPENSLHHLHKTLLTAFPDCIELKNDPKRGINGFKPHLSVGQFGQNCRPKTAAADAAALQAQQELQAAWNPVLEFEVTSVALISRQGNADPFKVRYLVHLGSGTGDGGSGDGDGGNALPRRVQEVNEAYLVD
jgi:hypothetical protein